VNAGEYLHWSGDSRAVHYALGDELFTQRLDETFAFVPGAPAELPKVEETGVKIGFTEKADKPVATVAIVGARIVTMRKDEVIPDGTVVVRENRIVAVGPPASWTRTGTAGWARTRSFPSRAGSTSPRSPSG
jgi:hypothetical protein